MDTGTQGDSKNCGSGGMCGKGCGIYGGGRHWMHVVVKIAIALIVFWAGVQFGELKAIVRSGYSQSGMMGGYPTGMMYRGY